MHWSPSQGLTTTAVALALLIAICARSPAPASANLLKPICGATKLASGVAGRACSLLSSPGKLLGTAKKLLTGHVGSAVKSVLGSGGPPPASTVLGLAAIGTWVIVGARAAMSGTAKVLGATTSPVLTATWFSNRYWRIAGIASLLTLPFLCAAAVQALLRSDLSLLARAAFGYLPLAMLAVGVAAPVTMLLLAASDEMSALISSAAGNDGTHFLAQAGAVAGFLGVFTGSPFLAFLVGLLAAAAAIVLWLELLAREAAVYVVVLLLPLTFTAMVWPARRIWAIRAVEMLVALILSKFVIVAVLSLGAAALGHLSSVGIGGAMSGTVLVLLAAFAPWALLRLLPLSELAAGAAGSLRGEARNALNSGHEGARAWTSASSGWGQELTTRMRGQAGGDNEADPLNGGGRRSAESETARLDELAGTEAVGGPPLPIHAGEASTAAGNGASGSLDEPSEPERGFGSGGDPGSKGGFGPHPDPAAAELDAPAAAERSPGMEPIWQAPDGSWTPLAWGPAASPTQPLWPPTGEGGAPGPRSETIDAAGDRGAETTAREGLGAGEDHDPLPPGQDPEDGRL